MELRKALISACYCCLEKRARGINLSIEDLEENIKLETKSSAGDKYETGRAMLHLELEKFFLQAAQVNQMKKTLRMVSHQPGDETVNFGSIV